MAQSTALADTGNGGSVTATGVAAADGTADADVQTFFDEMKVRRIEFPEETLERIDASHLGTQTYREYIPADLTDPPQLNLTVLYDTFHKLPTPGMIMTNFLVTYPLRSGELTAATYGGSAYVGAITRAPLANGELMEVQLRIDFDGGTGPALTVST